MQPKERSSSAGPTLVHHAIFSEPVLAASSSSAKYSAMTSRIALVARIFLMALFSFGNSLGGVVPELLALAAFAVFFSILAARSLRVD